MLFVIIGHDAPDAKEKRPQHRPAHLAHLEPLAQQGKIVLAGPFTDGSGSLIVVEAASREAVWELVARDPYVTNGIFNRVEVKPFLQVFPHLEIRKSKLETRNKLENPKASKAQNRG